MQRRTLLTTGSALLATSLAGCSTIESLVGMGDDTQYKTDLEGDAFLPRDLPDDAPDDMNNHHGENENFARMWMTEDESVFVLADAQTYESIETAEDEFEKAKARAGNDESYPVGDQAIIYEENDENARVMVQHSNMMLQTVSARQSNLEVVPDRNRASAYAELLFEDVKAED